MADDDRGTAETEQLGPSLWVLELAGEHDLATLPLVDAAFSRIGLTGMTVVVEFTQTSFIDSTVVSSLVKRSLAGETLLLVVPEASRVRRTLDLIGVPDLLKTFETRADALQAVPPEDTPPGYREDRPPAH
jgi:anti-anti-sigma regulatory factor